MFLRARINTDRLEIPGISCVKQARSFNVANLHGAEFEENLSAQRIKKVKQRVHVVMAW